jgi:hypothetical protein
MTKEIRKSTWAGIPVLLVLLAAMIATIAALISALAAKSFGLAVPLALLGLVEFFLVFGLFMVQPNNAVVLQLFGRYIGTVRDENLR